MTDDGPDERPPTDRRSPVGEPVIRGDAEVTGPHADEAKSFDPDDRESLAEAAETVRDFSRRATGDEDSVYVLRGAAACAALVRGEGSYTAAAERAGGEASVSFVRKWARVHDLPRSIRRRVATGHIAPTAAKHIARVSGDARYRLAWAALDDSLTVREVRAVASRINDGASVERAFAAEGVASGELALSLSTDVYVELRRRAALADEEPGRIVERALERWLDYPR